jgi:hypothetical protein
VVGGGEVKEEHRDTQRRHRDTQRVKSGYRAQRKARQGCKTTEGCAEDTKRALSDFAALNRLTEQIIGAAIEVHRHLGPGLLESVYETRLTYELEQLGFAVERQKVLPVTYKEIHLCVPLFSLPMERLSDDT